MPGRALVPCPCISCANWAMIPTHLNIDIWQILYGDPLTACTNDLFWIYPSIHPKLQIPPKPSTEDQCIANARTSSWYSNNILHTHWCIRFASTQTWPVECLNIPKSIQSPTDMWPCWIAVLGLLRFNQSLRFHHFLQVWFQGFTVTLNLAALIGKSLLLSSFSSLLMAAQDVWLVAVSWKSATKQIAKLFHPTFIFTHPVFVQRRMLLSAATP